MQFPCAPRRRGRRRWPQPARSPRSSGLPRNSASASCARHGLVASPPRPIRTSRTDSAAVQVQRHRGGGQREGVGLAVAYLHVERPAGPRAGRHVEAGDQLARTQIGLDVRRVAWQAVQVLERQAALAVRAVELHGGAKGHQRDGEVAGVVRDAVLADAQHGEVAVRAGERGTTRAGDALVAGRPARVTVVVAPGTLQNVAGQACHVTQLRACSQLQRLRQYRVVALHARMVGQLGHPHQRAQLQPVRAVVDGAKRAAEVADVDQPRRRHGAKLHQVEHRGAAGEELRAGCRSGYRLRHVSRPVVGESLHLRRAPTAVQPAQTSSRLRPATPRRQSSGRRRSGTDCRSCTRVFRRRCGRGLR